MEEKAYTITNHLNEVDFRKLRDNADAMELNTSHCIRIFLRLPIECKIGDEADLIIIISLRAIAYLSYQLRKQGHLLNQATNALNTVVHKVENSGQLDPEIME